jgi:soluble cytochrome b562
MSVKLTAQMAGFGVSESFGSLIDGLRETPGRNDKKFRVEDVNKLAQYLVCRNYGKACLELCYLCWAVINYPSDKARHAALLEFFWLNENISPARFRRAFEQPHQIPHQGIVLTKDSLDLQLNNNRFSISPTRVGVLAVLLEFIVTNAPQQLTLIEQSLAGAKDVSAIKTLSSELQKHIYHYLSAHLIQAQQQRRFRYVTLWLDEKGCQLPYLSDSRVLQFWQDASSDIASPGFKLYGSALNDMIGVEQAIQQAKSAQSLTHSTSIGFDIEAGEYSPDVIGQLVFEQASDSQDVSWLCQSPKFLTKAQWAFIEPIYQYQNEIKSLSLSFARLAVFGQWQSNLVQAKRKSDHLLGQKLAHLPALTYSDYFAELRQHKKVIREVNAAITHIFFTHQDLRYLGIALSQLPKAAADEIRSVLQQSLALAAQAQQGVLDSKALFAQSKMALQQSSTMQPPMQQFMEQLQQLMQAAGQAFKGNNKDGFKLMPDADSLDDYQDGFDALVKCLRLISKLVAQLKQNWLTISACEENYRSDVSIFKDRFDKIYLNESGDDNGEK